MEPNYSKNKETSLTTSLLMMTEYTQKSSAMPFLTRKMNSNLPKNMPELKEKKYQPKKNNKKKLYRKQKKTSISTSKLMIQKICNSDISISQLFSIHLMFKFNLLTIHQHMTHPKSNFVTLTILKKSKMPKMIKKSN